MRHAFSLCQVREAGTPDEWYDLLGVVRVPVDVHTPDKLRAGLRPWALATLTAGKYGFGRYHAGYSTLDEDASRTRPSPARTSTGPAAASWSPPRS
ncbi:hypothetical protein [Micromonospora haikouensis]|uniref:hypothetical protein n=1 Tax=Micromonospora haikouensis TaxID=686309 RepID=UPI003D76093F